MNKRIRQLAEQAGFYFYDMHDVDGQDLGETVEADSWSAIEKFTQLIVQECTDTCRSQAAGAVGTHASAHNSAVGACISAIQQQFGETE